MWLTRRVTDFILATSHHLVEKQLEQTHTPTVAKAISEFRQQSLKESVNFSVAYQPATKYPLGEEPLLVIDVSSSIVKMEDQDVFSIDFLLQGGKKINMNLPLPTLQSLVLLLDKLNSEANWGSPTQIFPPASIENHDQKKMH